MPAMTAIMPPGDNSHHTLTTTPSSAMAAPVSGAATKRLRQDFIRGANPAAGAATSATGRIVPVSYTHLTLPTILLV